MAKKEKEFNKEKFNKTNNTIGLWSLAFGLLGVASLICAFTVNGGLFGTPQQTQNAPVNGPDPKDYYGTYYAFDEEKYTFLEIKFEEGIATYSTHFGDHDYKWSRTFEYDYFTEEYAKAVVYSPNYSRDAIVVYYNGRQSNQVLKFWVFRDNDGIHFQNEGYREKSGQYGDLTFSKNETLLSSLVPPIASYSNTYKLDTHTATFNSDGTCEFYINQQTSQYNYVLTKGAFTNQMYGRLGDVNELELVYYDKSNTPIDNKLGVSGFFAIQNDGSLYRGGNSNQRFVIDSSQIYVSSISLNLSTGAELPVGFQYQLVAEVSPNDAEDKTISWSSSNPSVASVSQTGYLSCLKEGTAVISAYAKGGASTHITIEVYEPEGDIEVTKVEVSGPILVKTSEYPHYTATITPSNATRKIIDWDTSNHSVATISSNGYLTIYKEGVINITATAQNGVKGTLEVTISNQSVIQVSEITVQGSNNLVVGDETTYVATVSPNNATNKKVSWSSSNTSIISVDKDTGVAHALAIGTVSITATANNGVKGTITVTVNETSSEITTLDVIKRVCELIYEPTTEELYFAVDSIADAYYTNPGFSKTVFASLQEVTTSVYNYLLDNEPLFLAETNPYVDLWNDGKDGCFASIVVSDTNIRIDLGSFDGGDDLYSVQILVYYNN